MNNLGQTIEDYLVDCRARGLALKSVEDNYGYALRQVLLPWCDDKGITSVTTLDNRSLLAWQADLLQRTGRRGEPISRYSIDGWVKAVNTFLRWAKKNGEMDHEAAAKGVRRPKVVIEILSRQEIDLLERRAANDRDKLIVRVLGDTGIRASELLGLRPADLIRNEGHYLRVRGKGAKERLVPIPELHARLRRFIRDRDIGETERLFVGLHRRPGGTYEPLTISGLQKMLRALGREAGLTKRVYAHLFRHSYATHALTRGMNPIQLAEILGHSSLVMIHRNYAHLSNRDAYEAMAKVLLARD